MNKLQHAAEFRALLAQYRLSAAAKKIVATTKLVLLVAPTSSGRNTIINELLKSHEYYFLVSDTTRQRRMDNGVLEQDGIYYWYRTEQQMLRDLQKGEFLEAAVIHNQQVSGISVREVKKAHDSGKIAITDVEIVGAKNIAAVKPSTTLIFVAPPSFVAWMGRFHNRGTLPPTERRRRLQSAAHEFAIALADARYNFVINDYLHEAVAEINNIAHGREYPASKQAEARSLVEQLYIETQNYLKYHTDL